MIERLAELERWFDGQPGIERYGYRGNQWGSWISVGPHKAFSLIQADIKNRPAYQYRVNALATLKYMVIH